MKIAVIGAGPAGGWSAFKLAKLGHSVEVFEEHPKVGVPWQCTGIVTSQIEKMIDVDNVAINRIRFARIYAGRKFIEIKMDPENIILDRAGFDQKIAKLAVNAGADIHSNHRYLDNKPSGDSSIEKVSIKNVLTGKVINKRFNLLIGADGPCSSVAKQNSLWQDRHFWYGVQARVHYDNDNAIEFYPEIGTFAWIVPENRKIARIGLLAERDGKNIFESFLKEKCIKEKIDFQGGIVPMYKRITLEKGNVKLVGDAALQVKATTGGGIIQSMIAAEALAKAVGSNNNFHKNPHNKFYNSFHHQFQYPLLVKKSLGKELWLHSFMRRMMDRFEKDDWEYLVKLFRKKSLSRYLSENDRDNLSAFAFKMLLTEPRLLYFAKMLFR